MIGLADGLGVDFPSLHIMLIHVFIGPASRLLGTLLAHLTTMVCMTSGFSWSLESSNFEVVLLWAPLVSNQEST